MGILDQMKQLGEMKSRMEEMKRVLEETEIIEENEFCKITVGGNRKLKNIVFKTDRPDAEELRNTINLALDKTDALVQKEMMSIMPQIPGL